MRVYEIFRSIQGESTRAGLPMDFVRLAGCDLACSYCDTAAARDFAAGREMTVAEVLAACAVAQPPSAVQSLQNTAFFPAASQPRAAEPHLQRAASLEWLEITGGEPAHQAADVNALVAALMEDGSAALSRGRHKRRVMIETNGAHPIDRFDRRAVLIVDVKTPGSGMAGRNHWPNLNLLAPHDEVKFVLTGRADYEWAKEIVSRHNLAGKVAVLFSPAAPDLDARMLAAWIVADALPVRLNLQLHKHLDLP